MYGNSVEACTLAVEAAVAEAVDHGLDLLFGQRANRSADEA